METAKALKVLKDSVIWRLEAVQGSMKSKSCQLCKKHVKIEPEPWASEKPIIDKTWELIAKLLKYYKSTIQPGPDIKTLG